MNTLKVVMLPILIPQGLWAKWRTPRLNEAQGERYGSIGKGKAIKLLILGDSAAAGVGVDQQKQALIGQLIEQFDLEKYQIDWQLHAASGYSLNELITFAHQIKEQHFDIVIISSGVNDILKQHSLKTWQNNYQALYEILQNKFKHPHVLFSQVPPLQHFKALPSPLAWVLGQHAKYFNQSLARYSSATEAFHFVKIELLAKPEYLASDGFHPSAFSYTLWAQQIYTYLEQEHLI